MASPLSPPPCIGMFNTLYSIQVTFELCTCVYFQQENTCKHQTKVLWLLYPNLAEGTIAKLYASLKTSVPTILPIITACAIYFEGGDHDGACTNPLRNDDLYALDLDNVLKNHAVQFLILAKRNVVLSQSYNWCTSHKHVVHLMQ